MTATGLPLGERVARAVRFPRGIDVARALAASCDAGATLLDLGCGENSAVRSYAPHMRLVGVEADHSALAAARARATHDEFIHADIIEQIEDISEGVGGHDVQLVVLRHVIEHFPKRLGFELLDRAESISGRFVVVETPNRFLPQGPEYGNERQRHHSGWFPHDFMGLGYEVRGTDGTRYLRGYAGRPRIRIRMRGLASLDFVLARVLWIEQFPTHAFALTAWKDVRGTSARLQGEAQP